MLSIAATHPQAFIFASGGRAKRERTRNAEKEQRRLHVPISENVTDEPPPFVVVVQGPPGVRILHGFPSFRSQRIIVLMCTAIPLRLARRRLSGPWSSTTRALT